MNINELSAKASICIRKPPAAVFDAFADPAAMTKYWFNRTDDGLKQGESVTWYIGSGENAFAFEVQVKELDYPRKLVIEWQNGDHPTQITWLFEESDSGDTILTIEETGFSGDDDAILARVLDSTGGFNQVIIAAKVLIEHGIGLNVVDDHV